MKLRWYGEGIDSRGERWIGSVDQSSRSLDTHPLRKFIINSICSLIICISTTTWGGTMSTMDGLLMSGRSGLLGALLPSDPSWYLLSALVPSWSSSWVLCPAFLWRSCSSRSWFCLVRRSTIAVWVWTYLSRVVGRNSSPWTLLVVAIKKVSTMQLYVWEAIVWLIFFPTNGANWWCRKNHQWATQFSYAWNNTCTIRKEDLIENTSVVPAKYPPKVKLELLTTLECQSWGELYVPVFWGSLGFYSSVEPISYAYATSLFLIGKIFINVRIFQNPPYVRVPFVVGLYGLRLIVRHKFFPFRVSWKPHND